MGSRKPGYPCVSWKICEFVFEGRYLCLYGIWDTLDTEYKDRIQVTGYSYLVLIRNTALASIAKAPTQTNTPLAVHEPSCKGHR